jgi:hypothetical protein
MLFREPRSFRVSNKIALKPGESSWQVIFFMSFVATIWDSGRVFVGFLDGALVCRMAEAMVFRTHPLSVRPAKELVSAGEKKRGGEWGFSTFSRIFFLMHWEGRTLHIQAQLQPGGFAHLARMPGWLKNHFHIGFLHTGQS